MRRYHFLLLNILHSLLQLKCCWCSRGHVVINVDDHILVEYLYKFNVTVLELVNFLTKGVEMLIV